MRLYCFAILFICCALTPLASFGQEEDSAEIFSEAYSDMFQEYFFEALEQRANGNFKKAIESLLKCGELDATNGAVAYELARNYRSLKQYAEAFTYMDLARKSMPGEYWVWSELMSLFAETGRLKEGVALLESETTRSDSLTLLLTDVYVQTGEEAKATRLLQDLLKRKQPVPGVWERMVYLSSSKPLPAEGAETGVEVVRETSNANESPLSLLKQFMESQSWDILLKESSEVISVYPLQPEGYYYKAVALEALNRRKEAGAVLLEGADFLLDEHPLYVPYAKLGIQIFNEIKDQKSLLRFEAFLKSVPKQ